ncbi:uncharacterized protein VP01_10736g1, partial [Puccinia sorghi]
SPSDTLSKLQEIIHLEESRKTKSIGTSKISEKNSKDQTDSAAALMHESKKGKKKGKRGPLCALGEHNPEVTSHDAEHCWQLHPEQRPNSGFKSSSNGPHPPTTQLVEVNDDHDLHLIQTSKLRLAGIRIFLTPLPSGSLLW